MQFNNSHNLHSLNAFSLAEGTDGSSAGQGMNGSADAPSLGPTTQEYLMNASGEVAPVYEAMSSATATASTATSANRSPPPPTLIGSSNGLQFDLIWDSSVANAP